MTSVTHDHTQSILDDVVGTGTSEFNLSSPSKRSSVTGNNLVVNLGLNIGNSIIHRSTVGGISSSSSASSATVSSLISPSNGSSSSASSTDPHHSSSTGTGNNLGQPLSTNSDHSLDRHSPFSTTIMGNDPTPSTVMKQLPFSTGKGMSMTTPNMNSYSSIGGSEMPAFLAYETSNYGSSIHHDDPGISTGLLLTRGVLDSATEPHHHHSHSHHHSSSSSSNIMGTSSSGNTAFTSFGTNNGFTTFSHQNSSTGNRIHDDNDDAFTDNDDDNGPGFEIGGVDNEIGTNTSTSSGIIDSLRNGSRKTNISSGIGDTDVVDNAHTGLRNSSGLYTGSGSIDYTHDDLPPHPADTPTLSSTTSSHHAHLRTSQSNHRSITSSISSALAGNSSIKNSLTIGDNDGIGTGFTTIDKLHPNALTATPSSSFNTFDNSNNHGENNSTGYVYSPEDTGSITGTVSNNLNGMNVSWPSTGGKKRTVNAATLAAKAAAEAVAVAAAVSASGQAIFYTDNPTTTTASSTTSSATKKKTSKANSASASQTSDISTGLSSTTNESSTAVSSSTLTDGNNLTTKFNETTTSPTSTPRRGKGKKTLENNSTNDSTTNKSSLISTPTTSVTVLTSTASSVNNDTVSTTTSASVSVTGTPTSVGRARKKSRIEGNNASTATTTVDASSDAPTDADGTTENPSTTMNTALVKTVRVATNVKGRRSSKHTLPRMLSSTAYSSSTTPATITATNPNMLGIGSGGSLDAYAMTLVLLPPPDNNIKSLSSGFESTPGGDIDYTHGLVFPPGTLSRTKDPVKDNVRATHTLVERTLTHVEGNWTLVQDYVVSGHRIPITDNCMVPLSDPGPNRICPGYCGYVDLYTKLTYLARMSTRQILSTGLRSYNRLPCAMWVDPSKVLGEFFVVSFTLPGFFPSCPTHGTDKKSVKWKKSGSPQMRPMELSETYDAAVTPVQLMSQFAVARCIKTNVKLYSARVSCVVKDQMAQGIFMVQVRDARENHPPSLVSNSSTSANSNARSSPTDDDDE